MSQLQWGLIITGVLVLLGILLQNMWLARRNRPRQPEPSEPGMEDLVGLREPTLDAQAFEDTGFALPVPEKKPTLDALIDVIAPIALDAAVSGDAVLAAMPPTRRPVPRSLRPPWVRSTPRSPPAIAPLPRVDCALQVSFALSVRPLAPPALGVVPPVT